MLVLTRKSGECIIVADNIVIKVLGINGHQVRIGVEAPTAVIVDRQEVYERKKFQRLQRIANNDDHVQQISVPLISINH